ncbi:cation diffusion facilitator family transporter, partial [Candidatus Saccharibacteria bacterium]|nr:cation diffusion facilitator family transporter [Candidatus Saccharibacteria bacterium]
TIAVICFSILLKFVISRYFKRVGRETRSGSLEASGVDAMFDMLLTLGTLVGAVISLIFGISIDGWIGLVISAFIIKTAAEIITDGMTDVIGGRVDEKLVRRIREKIHEHEEVKKINRLVLHEYGPGKTIGAVKVEVRAGMEMREFKKLSEKIQEEMREEFGVDLTVGV